MASTGRPNKMHAVISEDGTTISQRFLQEVRNGRTLETTSALVGIERGTVRNWLRNGARVQERLLLNPDAQVDRDDLDYRDFLIAFDRAEAEAEAEYEKLMGDLARGGVTKRVTRKIENGQVVEETQMMETARPDYRALAWFMANRFGRHKPMEVRVNEGALSDEERADMLADQIEAFLTEQEEADADS